jgi:1-acyl-sn-glycerol-3-phosphate acyltransferase
MFKILSIVFFVYFLIISSYLLIFPGKVFNNNFLTSLPKSLLQSYLCLIFKYLFDLQFHIATDIDTEKLNENTDKIDIILANHVSTIDFMLITSYLNCFNIDGFNFVLRDGLLYYPGFGFLLYGNSDIKVKRKWEEDKNTITTQIDKIRLDSGKKQFIIIFCEGTRITEEKLVEGQQFSVQNDFPVYNNLLVPKSKGLQTIISYLNNSNKLGRVWDLSIIMPKFLGKACYINDIFDGKIGDVYTIFRELDLKPLNNIDFKPWLLNVWKDKDDIISNYKSYEYKKLEMNLKIMHFVYILLTAITSYHMLKNKYTRYYLYIVILISYIIIFIDHK